MEKLLEIIKEAVTRNIPVIITFDPEKNTMVYTVQGFSKSVNAKVYYDKDQDKILCLTRYDRVDEINSFEDLARVAYSWNQEHHTEIYGWDARWAPVFAEYGWEMPIDEQS